MTILPRQQPFVRLAALSASLVFVFGCATFTVALADDSKPEAPPPEISNPDYELTVSLKKSRLSVGEPIPVKFVLKNTGIQVVPVVLTYALGMHRMEIFHASSKQPVPFTRQGEQIFKICQEGSRAVKRLKPGEETASTLENLAEIYDLEKPGEYTLSVTRKVFSQVDPKQFITIRAPKLTFTVAPKE